LHPRVLERGKKVRMGSGETCIFHFTLLMFLIFMELGFFWQRRLPADVCYFNGYPS